MYCLQALDLLEYVYGCISKSSKNDGDSERADVMKSQLVKWMELLVNHLDMFAENAAQFVKLLQLQSYTGLKTYKKTINAKVNELLTHLL